MGEVTWEYLRKEDLQESASTRSRNAPEVPAPSVKMAVAFARREAVLRLRNKLGWEDGG